MDSDKFLGDFIRLEQGRERRPSDQVLGALARVLRLDADATDYLYELARPRSWPRRPVSQREQVSPGLLQLMRSWDHAPAFVIGRRLDVLATNRLTDALYKGMTHQDNCLRTIFLSPQAKDFYADWEKAAYSKTAQLRIAVGANPDDPDLSPLIEELSTHSEEFRRLWARHDVRTRSNEVKQLRHRDVGELTLSWEALTVSGASGQQLIVMAVQPDSPSAYALAALGRAVARDVDLDSVSPLSFEEPSPDADLGPQIALWPTRL
jgi:hypothetical protein